MWRPAARSPTTCRPATWASPGLHSATSRAGRRGAGPERSRRRPRPPPSSTPTPTGEVGHPTRRARHLDAGRPRGILQVTTPPRSNGSSEPMGSIVAENRKSLMLFSGQGFPELAEEIGQVLGVAPTPSDSYEFANGEIFVRFKDSVRGSDAFVVQSVTEGVNRWVMETLIMVDALKRGSAKRITVVLPFYPYSRQDKKHRGREPISARLVADLLKTAGANRILTVDLHTAQIQGFFDGPVDHMRAQNLLTGYIAENYHDHDMVVVSPDSGRVRVAERWADALGGVPLAFIHKTRDPLIPNQVKSNRVVGDVRGKTCIITDDMIDAGGTIAEAVNLLHKNGAKDVIIAATHGVLSDPAPKRLADCGAREVIVTNTLPIT